MAKHADITPAQEEGLLDARTASGAEWLSRYSGALLNVFGTPQRVLVRGAGPGRDHEPAVDRAGARADAADGHPRHGPVREQAPQVRGAGGRRC